MRWRPYDVVRSPSSSLSPSSRKVGEDRKNTAAQVIPLQPLFFCLRHTHAQEKSMLISLRAAMDDMRGEKAGDAHSSDRTAEQVKHKRDKKRWSLACSFLPCWASFSLAYAEVATKRDAIWSLEEKSSEYLTRILPPSYVLCCVLLFVLHLFVMTFSKRSTTYITVSRCTCVTSFPCPCCVCVCECCTSLRARLQWR
jgi:hypothetical protein